MRGPAFLSATPAARFFFRRLMPVILLFLPLFVLFITGGLNPNQSVPIPRPARPAPAINVTAAMVASNGTALPPAAGPTANAGIATVSDDAVNAISRGLYCPVCQNITLEVCPTDACARWREQVRDLLAEGKTETEIRQYFIDKFGMRTVGTPTDTAGQLIAVGLPFAIFALLGGYLAFRLLLFRSRRGGADSPFAAAGIDGVPPPPLPTPNAERGFGDEVVASVDYAARIEQELKDQP
jgi:cytochrome c-type biogenesis protein CcmH